MKPENQTSEFLEEWQNTKNILDELNQNHCQEYEEEINKSIKEGVSTQPISKLYSVRATLIRYYRMVEEWKDFPNLHRGLKKRLSKASELVYKINTYLSNKIKETDTVLKGAHMQIKANKVSGNLANLYTIKDSLEDIMQNYKILRSISGINNVKKTKEQLENIILELNPPIKSSEEVAEQAINTSVITKSAVTDDLQQNDISMDDYLYRVKKTLDLLIVGEDHSKMVNYLCGLSSKFTDLAKSDIMRPQSLFIQSRSASGKTYITKNVLKLFPDEVIKEASSLSPKSIRYWDESMWGQILFVEEWTDLSREAAELLRPKLSGSTKKSMIPIYKDGKLVTSEIGPDGLPAFMSGTTANKIDFELLNRCWVLHTDTSKKQRDMVLKFQSENIFPGQKEEMFNKKTEYFKNMYTALKSYPVFNPFGFLKFNFLLGTDEDKRHGRKLDDFIELVALVNQNNKPKLDLFNKEYIMAGLGDIYLAKRLLEPFFPASFSCIDLETREIYRLIESIKDEVKVEDIPGLLTDKGYYIKDISQKGITDKLQELYMFNLIEQSGDDKYVINSKLKERQRMNNMKIDLNTLENNFLAVKTEFEKLNIIYDPTNGIHWQNYKEHLKDPLNGKDIIISIDQYTDYGILKVNER